MKKLVIFFAIVVIIVCGIYYLFINYKANFKTAIFQNLEYEKYLNEEVLGSDLATVINKAIDNNKRNKIEKNKKGKYQNNDLNSINIDIKMLDDDNSVYNMEKIYNGGIDKFIQYYGSIEFKCTKIEYHESTRKIKYMLFEQITQ